MGISGDYNLATVQTTVGDFRVTGWAPDDAATVVPMADLFESESAGDGSHVSISRINDPRYELTLVVRRNTSAYRLLYEKLQDQKDQSDEGAVDPLSLTIFDPISGDKITEAEARFIRQPDMPFVVSASDATFKLLLPNPTIVAGANIVITS